MKKIFWGVLALATACSGKNEHIRIYPAPEGEELSAAYTVKVEGETVPVYQVKVAPADNDLRDKAMDDKENTADFFDVAAFAYFDMNKPVTVTVSIPENIQTVKILPASAGIVPEIKGNSLSFALTEPRKLTLDINGEWVKSLHLFANPFETDTPDPNDPNVIYFGPGIHEVDAMEIGDNKTLYIAGGAIVKPKDNAPHTYETKDSYSLRHPVGASFILKGKHIKVCGRGIIDASLEKYLISTIRMDGAKDVKLEGVILRNSSGWTVPLWESQDVLIDNLKIIGYRANSDGIDIENSSRVTVNDCFIRTLDDLVVIKSFEGSKTGDITIRKCVLWNQLAHALSIGAELRTDVDGIVFRDCDIIHDQGREWLLRVFHCDASLIGNVLFENIRIEESQRFISLWIGQERYTNGKAGGNIRNVVFKNIEADGNLPIELTGYDPAHKVDNVLFQNVVMNGRNLTLQDVKANDFVTNITVKNDLVETAVKFSTSDSFLGNLYKAADSVCKGNELDFAERRVLIEGGGYPGLWLETQPMGGEMYAKRNLAVGMNNVLLFMDYQRPDGRFPGNLLLQDEPFHEAILAQMKRSADAVVIQDGITQLFTHLQGYCFPYHALNLWYWNKKRDYNYLQALYQAMEAFDNYLWKYRDSDGNGCLETWCICDTGEDNSARFDGTKVGWFLAGETPPQGDPIFPVESMDAMSYSYDGRKMLAKIAALLDNGKEQEWLAKAQTVQDKLKSYLWDDARGACFDRNTSNAVMPTLTHNNLRAMYYGAFTQEMANRFVKEHLLNPDEFFTPMPLTSIAVNDPTFRNISENNWSGQPEGLTYQRAIRALENYGFYSEITLFGEKLINCVGKYNTFSQQIDPFTGELSEASTRKDYGPMALAVLEYISRFYGVHVQFDEIYWGALGRNKHEISYTQHWNGDTLTVQTNGGATTGSIDGKEIFCVSNGVRVVTDWNGNIAKIINIKGKPLNVEYRINGKKNTVKLQPNEAYPIK
ncbi:MAG: hypothetical protein LBG96_17940 [Tannerella sp.]|jgi:hypothetical protein|nr:hypothetical protein [Tannerella sp.]